MAAAVANARLVIGLAAAARATADRAVARNAPGPVSPAAGDKRFRDLANAENPLYFLLAQQYLLGCRLADELLDVAGLVPSQDLKARFASRFVLDALAPRTRCWATRPRCGRSSTRAARAFCGALDRDCRRRSPRAAPCCTRSLVAQDLPAA